MKVWTMVRLEANTLASLQIIKQAMQTAAERGQRDLPLNHQDHLSINEVVKRLAEDYWNHRRRSVESAQRRAEAALRAMQCTPPAQPACGSEDTSTAPQSEP